MTAPFPHRYEIELAWPGRGGALIHAASRPVITGGAPPEFDGRGSWWSPEHLLLSSLSLCLMTTFESVATKARLNVHRYGCRAEGVLDRTGGGLGFTSLGLYVDVEVAPEDAERASKLLASAKKHCIVANALKPLVNLDVTVRTPVAAGAA
jgi:organic hydroperoxide reductase OsmC/OhrA